MVWTKMLMKTSLVATLAGGFMFFGNATNVRADDRESCYQNVQNLERKLDRDVERHGADSRQAKHDRHEMEEARDSCQRRFGDYDRDRGRDHHDNDDRYR
ncbi:MAG: hypothetical protein JWN92_1006 [Candidatus Acidoferrum typicum]|jgi:hypothetical protein|nr:hypothetical protein [Candidatus Acidoferrum typicum]